MKKGCYKEPFVKMDESCEKCSLKSNFQVGTFLWCVWKFGK